ncbi:alpha-ribazole phosphatase [bacterium]|nr:alpha-ribazole phosphatase [bacterium]
MIYLLRHGELKGTEKKRFIGQTDLPLSEKGCQQALKWRDELAFVPFKKIYCSRLVRSEATARLIADRKSELVEIHPQLREINLGKWDGLVMSDIRQRYPQEWKERGEKIDTFCPPGGESFSDLYQRVIPAYEEIASETDGNILIVGHAGVNRMILCHVLGMPIINLFRVTQDYGALNLINHKTIPAQVVKLNATRDLLSSS